MQSETRLFFESLCGRCPGQSAVITLSAIHPDGAHPTPSRHIPLMNPTLLDESLSTLFEANRQGWGAYVGIAPRKHPLGRWARGTKGDLATLPALFVDIDDPDEETFTRIRDFAFPPSMVVNSGHGLHLYYLLREPSQYWSRADAILRGLAILLGGDEVLSIAQSLRVPSTYNTKCTPYKRCTLMTYQPERLYGLDDFKGFAAARPHRESTAPPVSAIESGDLARAM